GGYGGLAGVNEGIANVAEVKPAVDSQAGKHVDIIKLWMDDHLGTAQKMPYDLADAIIDAAHQDHLRVTAHIFYLPDAQHLVDRGVNGLAHSVRDKPVDDALIKAMKRNETWQMAATLSREASMFIYGQIPPFVDDPFFDRSVSPNVIETLKSASYQAKIRSDPEFSRYRGFLNTAEKKSQKAGRRRSEIWIWNRYGAARPVPRILRALGNGTHGRSRPEPDASSYCGHKEFGRISSSERPWHT